MKKLILLIAAACAAAHAQCPAAMSTMTASSNLSSSVDSKVCGLRGAGTPTASWCTTALIGRATYLNTSNGDTYACTANLTWTLKGATGPAGRDGVDGADGADGTAAANGLTYYSSTLTAGPDSTKTITGVTHGLKYPLTVQVYDNATPRNAVQVGWTVDASTYDVALTFGAAQSNYYVAIFGPSNSASTLSWSTLTNANWSAMTNAQWAAITN